jgi:hypothetical protein
VDWLTFERHAPETPSRKGSIGLKTRQITAFLAPSRFNQPCRVSPLNDPPCTTRKWPF